MAGRRVRKGKRSRGGGVLLRARTKGLRLINKFAFLVLVVTGCVAVAVLSVPQVRELRRLREELTRTEAREGHVLEVLERKNRELGALRSDPGYLELVARDRLDLYRRGERVFRIRR